MALTTRNGQAPFTTVSHRTANRTFEMSVIQPITDNPSNKIQGSTKFCAHVGRVEPRARHSHANTHMPRATPSRNSLLVIVAAFDVSPRIDCRVWNTIYETFNQSCRASGMETFPDSALLRLLCEIPSCLANRLCDRPSPSRLARISPHSSFRDGLVKRGGSSKRTACGPSSYDRRISSGGSIMMVHSDHGPSCRSYRQLAITSSRCSVRWHSTKRSFVPASHLVSISKRRPSRNMVEISNGFSQSLPAAVHPQRQL